MPELITGFNRDEFIEQLQDVVGNKSSDLRTYLQKMITAWQYEFLGFHDWTFLEKNGYEDSVFFVTSDGISKYLLNTATVGYEVLNNNVETIYSREPDHVRVLKKVSADEIVKNDPASENDEGYPQYWAPIGQKGIIVYPTPKTEAESLYVDCKVQGAELYDPANPSENNGIPIPYNRQSVFFQFCLYKTLQRERDPSAVSELQTFQAMLRAAISDDCREASSVLRIRSYDEYVADPKSNSIDYVLWNS